MGNREWVKSEFPAVRAVFAQPILHSRFSIPGFRSIPDSLLSIPGPSSIPPEPGCRHRDQQHGRNCIGDGGRQPVDAAQADHGALQKIEAD